VGWTVKTYLMYDHVPANLYRKIIVDTDGKKYRLRITVGEVSDTHPYDHLEKNRHSRLYRGQNEATEAAEILFKKFGSIGWHVYSPQRDAAENYL
jgi:hypothetical protein